MTQGVPGEDEMTSRAGPTILERILDGREPLLDLMSEYRAAIEQEVRDDIRARLEGPVRALHRWDCGRPASEFNEPLAEIVRTLAISSSSATETQDGERPKGLDIVNCPHCYGAVVAGTPKRDPTPTPDDRDREVERITAAVHESICTFEDHYVVHPVGGKVGPDQNYWTPCHILNVRALYDAGLRASGGD